MTHTVTMRTRKVVLQREGTFGMEYLTFQTAQTMRRGDAVTHLGVEWEVVSVGLPESQRVELHCGGMASVRTM